MTNIAISSFPTVSATGTTKVLVSDGDGSQIPLGSAVAFALEGLADASSIGTTDYLVSVIGGVAKNIPVLDILTAGLPESAQLIGTNTEGQATPVTIDPAWFTLTTAGTLSITGSAFPPSAPLLGMGGPYPRGIQLGTGLTISSTGTGTSTTFSLNASAAGWNLSDGTTTLDDVGNVEILGGTLSGSSAAATYTLPSGGSSWAITDGTHTVTSVTDLVVSGGSVSGVGTSTTGTATLTVTGGSGSALSIQQGTSTIGSVSTLVISSGITLSSGSSHTATLTASGGSSGPVRPPLSSFTISNSTTLCTATDITNGPIQILYMPTGTYLSITNWNQAVSGTEWLLTAEVSQSGGPSALSAVYATVGVGVKSTAGNFFNIRLLGIQEKFDIITWTNETTYNTDLGNYTDFAQRVWVRIYYQASDTSYPYLVLRSIDGNTWNLVYRWNGTSGVSAGFTAASVCFFVDSGGATFPNGGCIYHWDVASGTGSSLNPYNAVNSV